MNKISRIFLKLAHCVVTGTILGMFIIIPLTFAQGDNFAPPTALPAENTDLGGYGDVCIGLADKIRTGDLHLREISCFIKYFSQTLIAIAGSLSVIFVMVGGYHYIIGSASDDKDSAKRTITYALVGLAVSLLAWVLVDIALQLVTE